MIRPSYCAFALASALLCLSGYADATDVAVVGLFPGKAVLVIDSGAPKTYSVGNNIFDGIKLISSDASTATVEVQGKRQTITIGQHVSHSGSSGPASVTLQADDRGHFVTQGQINGTVVTMLVDTGATMVSLPAANAHRMGIDYKNGRPGYVNTANGTAPVYLVKLDRVKVGDIELSQVDAIIHESGLSVALLGMSFLNRTDMRRNGEHMILTKRF